jgi:hypothetical protein
MDLEQPANASVPIDPGLEVGRSYRVRVEVEGDTIRTFITPESTGKRVQIGYFRDLRATFSAGNVGFAIIENEAYEVHLFSVAPLEPRAPASP